MQVNNLINATTSTQQCSTLDLIQNKQEYLHLQIQEDKIFFSPLADNFMNKNVTSERKNNSITETPNLHNEIDIATGIELIAICDQLVVQIDNICSFYIKCSPVSFKDILCEIYRSTLDAQATFKLRKLSHALYNLITVLKNLQYQHKNFPETTIITKEAVESRLSVCLKYLHLCVDSLSSMLTQEYEIFNSIQQGLTGKIFLIRKYLFQTIASQIIQSLKQNKKYNIINDVEIHIYNLLHNCVAEKLGFIKIEDDIILQNFPVDIIIEFKKLINLEITVANITRILAEQLHDKLSDCLAEIDLQDWLDTPKTDINKNVNILETKFFTPVNMLFNSTEKLNFNSIIDTIQTKTDELYSLNSSQEKLHLWVALNLMPNSEKILIEKCYDEQTKNLFSIATIDNIFYWVINHNENQDKLENFQFNSEIYTSLTLQHLQKLSCINFDGIKTNENLYLSEDDKQKSIITSLISQALYYDKNAKNILFFFTDNNIKVFLQDLPFTKKKVETILTSKLSDNSFKKNFIDGIKEYYNNPFITLFTHADVCFFIQYKLFNDIISEVIDYNLNLADDIFDFKNHKMTTMFIQQFIKLPAAIIIKILNYKDSKNLLVKKVFMLAMHFENDKLIYLLLKYCNYSLENNMQYNICLSLATKNNHDDLVSLLVNLTEQKINSNALYNSIFFSNDKIYHTVINSIKNIIYYNKNDLLSLLQAINYNEKSAIFDAFQTKKYNRIKDYFNFIFSLDQLTREERLFIICAINENVFNENKENFYSDALMEDGIRNCCQIILEMPDLSIKESHKILKDKDENSKSIFDLAIERRFCKINNEGDSMWWLQNRHA